jgi:predicted DNA-binding protein (MmcQ/YjbR family)
VTDEEALRRIRQVCFGLGGVEEVRLQDRPLFRVGRRRFAIFNGDDAPGRVRWSGVGRSLHVLTDPGERESLRQDPRFFPSPHHAASGWLGFRLDAADVDDIEWDEVAELLDAAHRQVVPRPSTTA